MANLVEQLKQTPKWVEFEKWWNDTYTNVIYIPSEFGRYLDFEAWCNFPFEFQSGVFRKFMESDKNSLRVGLSGYTLTMNTEYIYPFFDTFKELIIWYFNN